MNNQQYEGLIFTLKNELGLDFLQNGEIYDQDYNNILKFNGKSLKVPINGRLSINPKYEIEFNPLNNPKLMGRLFEYYLQKLNQVDGRYILIYYYVSDPIVNGRMAIEVKEGDTVYRSKYYYNECLRLLDIILTLGGYTNIDYTIYDERRILQ